MTEPDLSVEGYDIAALAWEAGDLPQPTQDAIQEAVKAAAILAPETIFKLVAGEHEHYILEIENGHMVLKMRNRDIDVLLASALAVANRIADLPVCSRIDPAEA